MKYLLSLLLVACCSFTAHAAEQNDLGGMQPAEALEYMKTKGNLIIGDVATKEWFAKNQFVNPINIPIE